MKTDILTTMKRSLNMTGLKFKKHSPEIMVVAGVVGMVASAVMACKATTKVSQIIDDTKEEVAQVHRTLENPVLQEKFVEKFGEEYTEEQSKKDLAIVYAHAGLKFVKLYGPAVLLGGVSIASILFSHDILRKRNVALAAAYATIDKGFKEYRGRVIERFGEQLDRELKYNIRAKEVTEVTVNEDGTHETTTKTVEVADPNALRSDYAKFFDEYCDGWVKDAEMNLVFLKHQQSMANKILQDQGYLFLNDVYKMLGIQPTKAGQVVGWVYDEENQTGDNYVDFGLYDIANENARDFVNGRERSILLDFNVDGVIYDILA